MLAMPDGDKGEVSYRTPQILPDGKTVLFNIWLGSDKFQTAAFSLETGEKKIVVEESRTAHYSPTGHLVYGLSTEGTLVAVPFDLAQLEVTGNPVPLLEGIRHDSTGDLDYALSDRGTLVYVPSGENLERSLVWVDRRGTERLVTQEKRYYATPHISPDGQRMSVTALDRQGGMQVWIYEISRGILTPLTFDRGRNLRAIWTPDGKRLTYHSHKMAQDIFWKATDGTAEEALLTTNPNGKVPTSWSPDGKILAFSRRSGIGEVGSDWDVWLLSPEDGEEPQPFVATEFDERAAVFSPDGRWIAFTSDQSGQDEVYVKPYLGEGGMVQISSGGGGEPLWERDGNELFYRNGDQMMIVSVQTNPVLRAEKPGLVFEGSSYLFGGGGAGYDISTDGQQFLMVKAVEGSTGQINVILNWFEELKRLVPTP